MPVVYGPWKSLQVINYWHYCKNKTKQFLLQALKFFTREYMQQGRELNNRLDYRKQWLHVVEQPADHISNIVLRKQEAKRSILQLFKKNSNLNHRAASK